MLFNFFKSVILIKLFIFTSKLFTQGYRQNRESAEGCSKSIVRKNNDKFWKRIGLNK